MCKCTFFASSISALYSSSCRPGRYYDEGGFDPRYASPEGAPRVPFGFGAGGPRSEGAFGVRVPSPSIPDGLPLSLAPLPENSPYREEEGEEEEEEDDSWRPGPPFPPYGGRRGPAEPPRRVYERELVLGTSVT